MVSRLGGECRGSIVGDDPTASDDDGARADRLDLFQNVGRDHDDLVLRHLVDQDTDFLLLIRIEAVGGLVQDQHRRVTDHRLRETHAASKAF